MWIFGFSHGHGPLGCSCTSSVDLVSVPLDDCMNTVEVGLTLEIFKPLLMYSGLYTQLDYDLLWHSGILDYM